MSNDRTVSGLENVLLAVAQPAAIVGALVAVASTWWVGRNNPSHLLIALFFVWVLAPFAALLGAARFAPSWPQPTRVTLYAVTIVIAVASFAIYGNTAFAPPKTQAAFVFVVFPPASWLLMLIALSIATFISRRRSRRG